MGSITITLSDEAMQKLRKLAEAINLTPEELVSLNVKEWLQQSRDDFASTSNYVLRKNAALYHRLASATFASMNQTRAE